MAVIFRHLESLGTHPMMVNFKSLGSCTLMTGLPLVDIIQRMKSPWQLTDLIHNEAERSDSSYDVKLVTRTKSAFDVLKNLRSKSADNSIKKKLILIYLYLFRVNCPGQRFTIHNTIHNTKILYFQLY